MTAQYYKNLKTIVVLLVFPSRGKKGGESDESYDVEEMLETAIKRWVVLQGGPCPLFNLNGLFLWVELGG